MDRNLAYASGSTTTANIYDDRDSTAPTVWLFDDDYYYPQYYTPCPPEQSPPPPPLPKYDPFGARQMWQRGYPRIREHREKAVSLTPRFNQIQHTSRPKHGRRGRK